MIPFHKCSVKIHCFDKAPCDLNTVQRDEEQYFSSSECGFFRPQEVHLFEPKYDIEQGKIRSTLCAVNNGDRVDGKRWHLFYEDRREQFYFFNAIKKPHKERLERVLDRIDKDTLPPTLIQEFFIQLED